MYKLEKIFRTAIQYKASDIFISTGVKPALRINGDLVKIEEHPVLTKKMAEEYLLEILTPEQKKNSNKLSISIFRLISKPSPASA